MNGYEVIETEEDALEADGEDTRNTEEGGEVVEVEDEVEVEPDLEAVCSFNDCAWEDFADDSDDCLIVSFQFLLGREDNYEDTDILIDT